MRFWEQTYGKRRTLVTSRRYDDSFFLQPCFVEEYICMLVHEQYHYEHKFGEFMICVFSTIIRLNSFESFSKLILDKIEKLERI